MDRPFEDYLLLPFIFLALLLWGFFGFKDKVLVDTKHAVICIQRYGKTLGCMTESGKEVSVVHVRHGRK